MHHRPSLRPIAPIALLLGVVGIILTAVAGYWDAGGFYQSWLFASLFWLGLSLGCLAVLMMHRLTGGEWGHFISPVLRAGAAGLPLVALAFLPLLFGVNDLYPWSKPAETLSLAVQKKLAYLNVPFFQARTAGYLLVWLLLAMLMRVWHAPEQLGATGVGRAVVGLILHTLMITFFSIDWVMSLDPEFYSAIFGAIVGVGQMLVALALALLVTSQTEPWRSVKHARHQRHDLGNLVMAFLLLWMYLVFSQLLIIWSADLPHEIRFYIQRASGSWLVVASIIALFHFAIPFAALVSRRMKDSATALSVIAGIILAAHVVDLWWLIMPTLRAGAWDISWLDAAAMAGLGGVWLAIFCWRLAVAQGQPLAATGRLAEAPA